MRIGEVIGTVTLSRVHPSLAGATLRLAIPLTLGEVSGRKKPSGEALVVYDELARAMAAGSRLARGARRPNRFIPTSNRLTPITRQFSMTFFSADFNSTTFRTLRKNDLDS